MLLTHVQPYMLLTPSNVPPKDYPLTNSIPSISHIVLYSMDLVSLIHTIYNIYIDHWDYYSDINRPKKWC